MRLSLTILEEKMRHGQGAEVREALEKWGARRSALPASDLALAAQLCWRSGLPELGLKLLHPVLRPRARRPVTPGADQRAEYAACLLRLEAHEEASEILGAVSPRAYPRVWLYRALAKIGTWEYAKAIPLLRAYLKSDLPPYEKLVGQVNLASALIYERKHREARPLLRELTHEASLRGLNLLLANSLELSAANFIYEGQGRLALPFLDRAEKLLEKHGNIDAFYVEKWRGILAFQKERDEGKALQHLEKIRRTARACGHWESLRDCDRFAALRTREPALVHKVFFGTPYPSYRAHLLAELAWKAPLPEIYSWDLAPGAKGGLDFLFGHKGLKPGQATFRLALALASDFYRPHRVGPLFARLFPGEYFNPHSSPHRVHELVWRLRAWQHSQKLPLAVVEKDGAYAFEAKRPCSILVPLSTSRVARWRLALEDLRKRFPGGDFGVTEASRHLGISSMSLLRLLGEALHEKAVSREGQGKATRYRFAPKA